MKGDFTRFTFAPQKHYDAVLMQQGRVQTDADWNEQVMIAARRLRTETSDVIGPTGAPQDLVLGGRGAFVVYWDTSTNQLTVNQGRYYANGQIVEGEAPLVYTSQPGAVLPPPQGAGIYLLYLDLWDRHMTALEDPGIREVALAGADSGTRSQLAWQVRAQLVGAVGDNINSITVDPAFQPTNSASTGKMDAQSGSTPLENQLYRVEIHRGGTAAVASCKWSRDNGTVVAGVLTHSTPVAAQVTRNNVTVNVWQFTITIDRAGRDSFSSFLPGQMVELSNNEFVLQRKPGIFGTITVVVGDTLSLEVPQAAWAPMSSTSPIQNPLFGTIPTVRRWDNLWNPDDPANASLVNVGADYTTGAGRLILERDITVKFASAGSNLYQTGDFWLVPARTITSGLIDWVPNVQQPPAGEEHSYAPLALVRVQANGVVANPAGDIRDVRQVFPTLRSLGGGGGGGIVTGTGTKNYVPKWQATATSVLTTSSISDDGTTVAIAEQLQVGTGGVPIIRFTSAAISGQSVGDLAATLPTSGNVKSYVEGVVNGTTGHLSKFTGAHLLGDSLLSESGTTVTVGGSLKVGTAGTSVAITRFTSEAIQSLSPADLASTVPTAQAVENFMAYSVPPGTVMAYASEIVPPGWLECNGFQYSSATYPALYAAIGTRFGNGSGAAGSFNVPDLRGKFLRGWNHGSGWDPDAGSRFNFWGGLTGDHVGSYQFSQFASHGHSVSASGTSGSESALHNHSSFNWAWTGFSNANISFTNPGTPIISTLNFPDHSYWGSNQSQSHTHFVNVSGSAASTGGSETRPVNVNLMYIIKY